MKQLIYKFLDEYVGPGIQLTHNEDRTFYNIFSDNKTQIITFRMTNDWENIKLFRSDSLCKTLSRFFCISEDEAAMFTKDWFGDRHNLKKVGDLRKFVPQLTELQYLLQMKYILTESQYIKLLKEERENEIEQTFSNSADVARKIVNEKYNYKNIAQNWINIIKNL